VSSVRALGPSALLVGDSAERARHAVSQLVAREAHAPWDITAPVGAAARAARLCLASGGAGLALLHAERARANESRVSDDPQAAARAHLHAALAALATVPLAPWLFAGLAGPLWVLRRLRRAVPACAPDVSEQDLQHIDRLLEDFLSAPAQVADGAHELVAGVAGLGVYALERVADGQDPGMLTAVLAALRARARIDGAGLVWRASRGALEGEDWGLAHGIPGVIAFLARAQRFAPEARELLEAALASLLALPAADPAAPLDWPCWSDAHGPSRTARCGWCYGTPGVVAALYAAGESLGRPTLCARAVALMRRAWTRRAEAFDGGSGLCHGRAGLLHLLTRLHAAQPDQAWQAAGALVVEELAPAIEQARWDDAGGLLTGSAGIELALRAALDPDSTWWDGFLLLDFGPRGTCA
jgi:hypothetical protein